MIFILLITLIVFFIFRAHAKKQLPVTCKMYFGAPRSGKTTIAVQEARRALRLGIPVYTNFPVAGCYKLDPQQIGTLQYRNALLIVDEAGIDFNNRDYKNFSKQILAYIKLHGHYHTRLLWLSQGWDDCDKKIRTICTEYWYIRKLGLLPISYRRRMSKRVGIDDNTHQIIDEYFKLFALLGGLRWCWRPKYYRYFDSWDAPVLPDAPADLWSSDPPAKKINIRKKDRNKARGAARSADPSGEREVTP